MVAIPGVNGIEKLRIKGQRSINRAKGRGRGIFPQDPEAGFSDETRTNVALFRKRKQKEAAEKLAAFLNSQRQQS